MRTGTGLEIGVLVPAACLALVGTVARAARHSQDVAGADAERAWFYRISREDIDWESRKGVASEGPNALPRRLCAKVDELLSDLQGRSVWLSPQPVDTRMRVVAVQVPRECEDAQVRARLKKKGFDVERLLVTGIQVETSIVSPNWCPRFLEAGGVFHYARDDERGLFLVAHTASCKPERLVALAEGGGPRIAQDRTELEVRSGELGEKGERVETALRGLPGVRVVKVDVTDRRIIVAVEMRALKELRFRRGRESAKFETAVGAPILDVLERLRKAGIEAREVVVRPAASFPR